MLSTVRHPQSLSFRAGEAWALRAEARASPGYEALPKNRLKLFEELM